MSWIFHREHADRTGWVADVEFDYGLPSSSISFGLIQYRTANVVSTLSSLHGIFEFAHDTFPFAWLVLML